MEFISTESKLFKIEPVRSAKPAKSNDFNLVLFILFSIFFILFDSISYAQPGTSAQASQQPESEQRPNILEAYSSSRNITKRKITTRVKSGIQSADFKWNIASNLDGDTPSILSELKYEKLEIQHQSLSIHILPSFQSRFFPLFFEFTTEIGKIRDGKIQDSDYDGDNRTEEYSRSISSAEGSNTFTLNTAVGYPWLSGEITELQFLLGFSYHNRYFEKTQGIQVISTPGRTPNIGTINGLNSSYDTYWYGPWIGFRPSIKFKKHSFGLTFALHLSRYYAAADWNLREDFAHPKSFEHKANGFGQVLNLTYQWSLNEKFELSASFMFQKWQTHEGVDTLFFANGNTASTRLNETQWNSEGVDLGFNWKF